MAAARIVLLAVVAAVLYGVAHDLVTARLCVEYFTIGHPPVFVTDSPTLLALGWGVIATWWVGLLLGLPLAFAARRGPRPKRSARSLVRPISALLLCMAGGAVVAAFAGWFAAGRGWVFLVGRLAEQVPADRHVAFLSVLWAHSASYLVGFVGGAVLVLRVWRSRRRQAPAPR